MKLTIQKSTRFHFISLLALGLGISSGAHASAWGPYIEVTAFPAYSESNPGMAELGGAFDGKALNTAKGFSFDLRNTLGVKPAEWLLIGGTYNYGIVPLKREATADLGSLDSSTKNWEIGPTVGFFYGNWRILGTYLLSGKLTNTAKQVEVNGTVDADAVIENKLKSGFQVTAGYSFSLTPTFKIGPTLSYRRLSYKSQSKTNNANSDPAESYTDKPYVTPSIDGRLVPMVTMALSF